MNPRIHFEVPAYSAPDIEAVVLQSRLFRSKSMSRGPIRIAIVLGGGEPFVVQCCFVRLLDVSVRYCRAFGSIDVTTVSIV